MLTFELQLGRQPVLHWMRTHPHIALLNRERNLNNPQMLHGVHDAIIVYMRCNKVGSLLYVVARVTHSHANACCTYHTDVVSTIAKCGAGINGYAEVLGNGGKSPTLVGHSRGNVHKLRMPTSRNTVGDAWH